VPAELVSRRESIRNQTIDMKYCPALLAAAFLAAPAIHAQSDAKVTGGRLDAMGPKGEVIGSCPLKHTAVDAEISGSIARVSVTQQFQNPFKDKIEAVYVFPLHQDSAVDEMTMTVGDRIIKGIIKERGEAKRVYDEAKASGKVASLLDQERPNIFTQTVANIEPGQQVTVTIHYSQTLAWEDGRYQFDFPTVVGPRYIPGTPEISPDGKEPTVPSRKQDPVRGPEGEPPVVNPDPAAPTDQVPDANRITPPVVEEGYRAGHDLSIKVRIHAGLPIADLKSALHEIVVHNPEGDATRADVSLAEKAEIPNRDFSISYRTAGENITDAALTHTNDLGKFFTLVLQAPARVKPAEVVPRELIFVLDTSGSMSGFPIETSKAIMRRAIENLRPADRFNVVTFAGHTSMLFEKPVDNTEKNRHRALGFIDTLKGAGGTEMMKAINSALGDDHDPNKVRVVCFLTDGYVGNDLEIVDAVKKHAGTTRVFSFGIGTSVNRFLLDSMAQAGRGEACYVLSHGEAKKAADKFYERIDAPVLTDITLDFGNLAVEEVFPQRIEDLFAAKPVVIKGRYTKGGPATIKLKGRTAAGNYEREIAVNFPEENPDNRVLASQWARAKVGHLMMQDMQGAQREQMKPELKEQIIKLGIDYHLLTQFTSFVAVEERRTTEGGAPRTVQVPIEMPEGVSYSGNFGEMPALSSPRAGGLGGGGSGFGSGSGKYFGLIPGALPKPNSKEERLQKLKENGGTPACEEAVVKSLDWLKQSQNPDGSWGDRHKAAMTGYALLAYLGHCDTPISERYGETVLKAMVYLMQLSVKHQGRLTDNSEDPQWLHAHAIATTALAESLTFCKELRIEVPGLEEAVRKSGQWIIDHQSDNGAWKSDGPYPEAGAGGSDILLTCANLQALKAATYTQQKFTRLAESTVKALRFIETCQNPDGSIGPVPKGNAASDPALTGAGAVAHQLWGKGEDKLVAKACDYIASKPKFQWNAADSDLCALHYNALAMIHRGGKKWTDFNTMFLPEVLKSQDKDGSYQHTGTDASNLPIAGRFRGGPKVDVHYRTCLATLTLEVYYRILTENGARR